MFDPVIPAFFGILISSIVATYGLISAIGKGIDEPRHEQPPAQVMPEAEPPPPSPTQTVKVQPPPPSPEREEMSLGERLRLGLHKTRAHMLGNLEKLLAGKARVDADLLEQMHEVLYRADVGNRAAEMLVQSCQKHLSDKDITITQVKDLFQEEVSKILAVPETTTAPAQKNIVLMVGVNGVGKTTTIGKLAHYFREQQKSVLLCAADTFRAAAIDQLQVWGDRLQVEVVKHKQGADPGAVVFDAVQSALKQNTDVLLVDTAGRLHNKTDLMAELAKIKKIASKHHDTFNMETWIVLDATTGQNAISQVKTFLELVQVSGIIITKLDGTAKGGVIIGICEQFKIPVQFIGVGEQLADLKPFNAKEVATSIFS